MRQPPNSKGKGRTVTIQIHACVRSGSGLKELKQDVEMPKSLRDAIKIYGEQEVFKLFVDSLVIRLQAKLRASIKKQRSPLRSWADAIMEAE